MTSKRQFDGERVKLGEICEVNPRQPRSLGDDDEVAFIPLAAVSTDGTTGGGTSTVRSEVRKGHPWFQKGDILLAKITPSFENGKIAITDCSSNDGYASTEFHVVRPNLDAIDDRYLLSYLRTAKVRKYCAARMKGSAGQRRVPVEVLKALPVPVAPMTDQRRIADVLSKINLAIGARKNVLSRLDALVKSRFVEMFGNPQAPNKSWSSKSLGSICEIVTGNTPSRKDPTNYGNHIEWIKTDNISGEKHLTRAAECLSESGMSKGRTAPAGSVLMACIAGGIKSIGKVAIADRPVAFNQQINALVPGDDVLTDYLYWALKLSKSYLCSNVNMQLKGILNKTALSAKELSVPPLSLQQQFADFVAKVDKPRFAGPNELFHAISVLCLIGGISMPASCKFAAGYLLSSDHPFRFLDARSVARRPAPRKGSKNLCRVSKDETLQSSGLRFCSVSLARACSPSNSRATRQPKGGGLGPEEETMSNEIRSKAVKAVIARCEAKGWEVVEHKWHIPTGANAIVMKDEDALVFVNVTVSSDGFDEGASLTRGEFEMLAMTWLESHDVDGDVAVRFDEAAFHVASDGNRALLRYHYNVMGR